MKEDMMDDDMGRAQGPSRRRDFQDIPPQSKILQNIVPDFRKLTSHPPGTKASVAQPRASGNKETSQKKNGGDDYAFLFKDARFGGPGGAYYGNNNKQRKDGNRMSRRENADENPPNDQDPDDDHDDDDGDDDATPNVDGHRGSGSRTCQ